MTLMTTMKLIINGVWYVLKGSLTVNMKRIPQKAVMPICPFHKKQLIQKTQQNCVLRNIKNSIPILRFQIIKGETTKWILKQNDVPKAKKSSSLQSIIYQCYTFCSLLPSIFHLFCYSTNFNGNAWTNSAGSKKLLNKPYHKPTICQQI